MRIFSSFFAIGLSFVLVGVAQAATITWGAATNSASSSDIADGGEVIASLNGGQPSLPDLVLNDVTFTGNDITGGGTAGGMMTSHSTGDTTYDSFLTTLSVGGGSGERTRTVHGLTIGSDYLIQIWFTDLRNATSNRTMRFGDGNGNTVDLKARNGAYGQYAIGTFTADATSQDYTMDPLGFSNGHITGLMVREAAPIPEPSTAILLGIGLLGLAKRARR